MKTLDEAIKQLTPFASRYRSLKSIFTKFQAEIIKQAISDDFPVKGITLSATSDTETRLGFLGRLYVVSFSMKNGQGILEFSRINDNEKTPQMAAIASIAFDAQGIVNSDTYTYAGDSSLCLTDYLDGLTLLMNWILDDVVFRTADQSS